MRKHRSFGICAAVLCFLLLLPLCAHAAQMDPKAGCSLTLRYTQEGVAFSGLEISIYRVAEAREGWEFQKLEPYSGWPVNIHGITSQAEWQDVASTLKAYIVADQLAPTHTAVTDEEGRLYGLLTQGDIAAYDMSSIQNPVIDEVPVFNLLSVLEGRILNEAGNMTDSISGEVVLALPKAHEAPLFNGRDYILLCGQQPEIIKSAVEAGVRCVVLCQAELSEELRTMPTDTCIISTPHDACRAARLIYHAIPVGRVCCKGDISHFHLDDYIDDVREVVLQSRFRSYPILDENDKVVGTLSRFHLLRPRRKRVVLVDHNEASQSVPGLEQAELLEIIDHHRLADIQTNAPIYFRNETVGSTATIIAGMYQEKGLMPSAKLAATVLRRFRYV